MFMIITITIKVMMALVAAIVFDLWYDPVNGILIAASSRCVNRMAEHGSSHLGWEKLVLLARKKLRWIRVDLNDFKC